VNQTHSAQDLTVVEVAASIIATEAEIKVETETTEAAGKKETKQACVGIGRKAIVVGEKIADTVMRTMRREVQKMGQKQKSKAIQE
jgi:hypothetical protein